MPIDEDAGQVLVVEDDPVECAHLAALLRGHGYRVLEAASSTAALELFAVHPVDATVSTTLLDEIDGRSLLIELRHREPEAELVLLTAEACVRDAVAAIQAGAADYLEKPVDPQRLCQLLRILIDRRRLRQRVRLLELGGRDSTVFEGMVARSRVMREVFGFIERIAAYPTTVLLTGESGTGKELVARAIHARSNLSDRPLVVCNCSVLSPGLIESELFGHVRGAFTGADRDRRGLFEAAHGGTIFLDEIGEMPLDAQVKLLRVLENREIRRVGSPISTHVEIRVIAATHRSLQRMVADGRFREDLFYRLNVGAIELPPLRDRAEDVELLAERFLADLARRLALPRGGISSATLSILQNYAWPGNVRELSNVLERAALMARGATIGLEHLPPELVRTAAGAPDPTTSLSLDAAERAQIRRALDSARGKRTEAARLLGLSRRTLYRKLEKHGLHQRTTKNARTSISTRDRQGDTWGQSTPDLGAPSEGGR